MIEKDYLTPQEVARLLMVSPVTVRQWAQRGEIQALTTPGGHRRFLRPAVEAFARTRGIPLAEFSNDDELRVLVVDDDEQLNRYLVELLKSQPDLGKVESAYNGFEAGVKIESFKPNVVLLDLMMPGLDGFEVARFIRSNPMRSFVRIIAMTAYAAEENIARVVEAGAEACIAKPIDSEKLLSMLFSSRRKAIGQT